MEGALLGVSLLKGVAWEAAEQLDLKGVANSATSHFFEGWVRCSNMKRKWRHCIDVRNSSKSSTETRRRTTQNSAQGQEVNVEIPSLLVGMSSSPRTTSKRSAMKK